MTASPHTDAHLRAWIQACAGLPGGALRRHGGATWSELDIPWPMFSGGTGGAPDDVRTALEALRAGGRPFFWWTTSATPAAVREVLVAEGLECFDDSPWEEASLAGLPPAAVPPGIRLEEARDEAGYRTWAATLRAIYAFPETGETSWIEPARRCGWGGLPWRQWTAFDDGADGAAVGVTLMFPGGGVASLFGVGVAGAARRRGIGRALTLVPLQASGRPVAGFFSTDDGGKLYQSLGFRPRGRVARWLWRPI